MNAKISSLAMLLVCGGAFACGGGGSDNGGPPPPNPVTSNPDAGVDAGNPVPEVDAGVDAPPPVDHGAPSTTYPAFPPDFVQIKDNGGPVLKTPVVVSITWNTDGSQASFDTFADTLGATTYWKTTTSEYGVGPATSGTANHVHITTAPPAKVQDSDIQTLVTTNAGKGGWPAPSADTIYAFFLPPGTSLQTQSPLGGGAQDACAAGEGGYHDQVTAGSVTTAYAVVPSCNFGGANTAAQQSTMSMSHELIEASTDPEPQTKPAYVNFDDDHFADSYFQIFQAETGDACEFFAQSFYEEKESTPVSFDDWVQRTWSNASGAAAHDPCVPAAGSVYFNVVPLGVQTVSVTIPAEVATLIPGLPTSTKGIEATVGAPVTFPVGFYSDGPTNGPWTISVSSGNPILSQHGGSVVDQYNQSSLTVSVDKTSGQNGEKAYVTVNVASPGSLFKGEIITVTSTLGGVSHYRPIWIASP